MTMSTGKRPWHIKDTTPTHVEAKRISDWFPPNQSFYGNFRTWLHEGGYAVAARTAYCVAARLALGLIDKPYWQIEVPGDLDRVRDFITTHYTSAATGRMYGQGLDKFTAYLNMRCHRPSAEPTVHWDRYLAGLSESIATEIREYVVHRRRNWRPDQQYRYTYDLLGVITRSLRWMATHATLNKVEDITPQLWFQYVDARLADHIQPITLNNELYTLQSWLQFVVDQEHGICQRMLRVDQLYTGPRLPRDAPLEQLRRMLTEIEKAVASSHAGVRRMGLLDRAWYLLMLHSGLRTSEARRLQLADIDWENRRVRIEQSKGLKDRIVCLSSETIAALKAYLEVRGPANSEHVLIYRHFPLQFRYCQIRLRTYGQRCGVSITPHQLRHSCATLLLNAGAPILTVQTILGHQRIDTTLGYARLYDGTIAADYYRAMARVEQQMSLIDPAKIEPPNGGQLLALIDALRSGTLNDSQTETAQALRAGILALVERTSAALDTDKQPA
jgi:site-specific recombinase XerD